MVSLRNIWITIVVAFSVAAVVGPLHADPLEQVRFDRPVIDLAGMLSEQDTVEIERLLFRLNAETGSQVGVITLNSLDGDTIESVSIKIADKWKLGDSKSDKGVLITVAKAERRMRIEVGQGLEGSLPDAYANRIIENTMTPYFRSGDYGTGIKQGILAIIARTNPNFSTDAAHFVGTERPERGSPLSPLGKLFTVLFVLFLIFTPMGRALLMLMLFSGGRGGRGGGSSWGGGGGGYRGGGGGFSGGGASGGW